MLTQIVGASVRAILVVLLIATPALMLPGGDDADHITSLLCIAFGVLILAEYIAVYPGLIEFRDAPPYNRIRYLAMLATLFGLSAVARLGMGEDSTLALVLAAVGNSISAALDFPFSPLRLMLLTVIDGPEPLTMPMMEAMLGLSTLISLLSLVVFVAVLRGIGWPSSEGVLNVWTNLPLFDPTGERDVAERLRRTASLNVSLGVLMPFFVPMAIGLGGALLWPPTAAQPQAMVWMVTFWASGPVWLFMRALALYRVAEMIDAKRRAADPSLALS